MIIVKGERKRDKEIDCCLKSKMARVIGSVRDDRTASLQPPLVAVSPSGMPMR